MNRRNSLVFLAVLIIFVIAALVVLPVKDGIIGGKDIRLGLDLQGGVHIVYQADLASIESGGEDDAMDGAIAILQNRVNPLGVTEPVIQKLGSDRILVELPGLSISDTEKERLARVDILQFGELTTDNASAKWVATYYDRALGVSVEGNWKPATAVIDGEEKELTSRYFKSNTQVGRSEMGQLELHFEWNDEGSELSTIITGRLIDQPLAIFDGDNPLLGENGRMIAPYVQSTITERGVVTGLSLVDATLLSQQLNFGRLPVALEIIEDEEVSPILGSKFVDLSVLAGLIGIALVMAYMILYYRVSGLLASLSLVFYGTLVMALFKLIPVTLTLSGLGGFILSIGMAVDANVLIFERMKEEFRAGRTLGAAIEAGFNRAWTAIRDGNITTLIVCFILYWLGGTIVASAPVKGFALTLAIGVLVSMFTAIIVTRTLLRLLVRTPLARKPRLFSPHLGRKDD
ncbi:protein translocase subunit SecD [Chloroflexota bacterium]